MSTLEWQPLRAGDEAALRAVQRAQCARTGERVPFPSLADPHLVFARVALRDGRPVGALLGRATFELIYISDDARVLKSALRRQPEFRRELRALGVTDVALSAFRRTLAHLEPLLRRAGFRRSDPDYVEFFQEL